MASLVANDVEMQATKDLFMKHTDVLSHDKDCRTQCRAGFKNCFCLDGQEEITCSLGLIFHQHRLQACDAELAVTSGLAEGSR